MRGMSGGQEEVGVLQPGGRGRARVSGDTVVSLCLLAPRGLGCGGGKGSML